MGIEIPETVEICDGCGDEINLLNPYLKSKVNAERQVLISEDTPSTGENLNDVPDPKLYMGAKVGRGVVLLFHDFNCFDKWVNARKGLKAKLEFHAEEGEPYVPEDNRTPEELVKAGELPKEILALQKAAEDFVPASVGGGGDE
jgi:hypothetical protein